MSRVVLCTLSILFTAVTVVANSAQARTVVRAAVASNAFSISSPANGASVSGTINISGTAGSKYVNITAYDSSFRKIASDVKPANGSFKLSIDTTALPNGSDSVMVMAFTVPAGQQGGQTASKTVSLNVKNYKIASAQVSPSTVVVPAQFTVGAQITAPVALTNVILQMKAADSAGHVVASENRTVSLKANTAFAYSKAFSSSTIAGASYNVSFAIYSNDMKTTYFVKNNVASFVVKASSVAANAFSVSSPANGASEAGTFKVSGVAGSQWMNVAAFTLNWQKISNDATPANNAFSLNVDSTKLAQGANSIQIVAFSVPAGQQGGASATVLLSVNVSNIVMPAPAPAPAPAPQPTAGCSTTYYVAANGNDSNSGTSPSSPWKTITKANAGSSYAGGGLSAGQCLLFNGGDTFTGCLYMATGHNIVSSSAANPIVLGSYGTGNATIVGGSACQNTGINNNKWGAVMIDAAQASLSGFIMQNLTVRPGSGYGNGIVVQESGGKLISDIYVQNNDVGGFNTPNNNPYPSSEILVLWWTNVPSGQGQGQFNNINILNNQVHGLKGSTSPDSSGITIDAPAKNSLVSGNTVYDIGGVPYDTAAGILLINNNSGASNLVVSKNLIHDISANVTSCGGMSGIETANVDTVIIRNNEIYNVRPADFANPGSGCDFDGIDLDGSTVNSIVEYNYTHDNYGNGLLAWMGLNNGPKWGSNIYRYNISSGDGIGNNAISITGEGNAVTGLQFYNNTVYYTAKPGGYAAVGFVGWSVATQSLFANNLIVTTNGANHVECNNWNGGNWSLSGFQMLTNGYAGSAPYDFYRCDNHETIKITANPNFAGGQPPFIATNSALIGTGTAISNSGGMDFFGVAVPSSMGTGYSIGAGN